MNIEEFKFNPNNIEGIIETLIFLKKELKLNEFIIVFIAIVSILKCGLILYKVIIEYQNNDFLIFTIVGAAAIGWISYEKIHHIFKVKN